MRILLVKTKHIGDALLLTPTAVALRKAYPDAFIGVVVRKGCESILGGCPAINQVYVTAPVVAEGGQPYPLSEEIRLVKELRRQRFDFAFELSDNSRGRWLVLLSGAQRRCVNGARRPLSWFWRKMFHEISQWNWKTHHRVEKDYRTVAEHVSLPADPPPLSFVEEKTIRPDLPVPRERFAVMHGATRWKRKEWPEERWIEVGRHLTAQGLGVVVSCGPDPVERESAGRVAQGIGAAAVCTDGKLNWQQLAWLLRRAEVFIGVDTAAMHLAAASQCPVVGLFGESLVTAWSPWQTPHEIVRSREPIPPMSDLPARLEYQKRAMQGIAAADVIAAADRLLANRVSRPA